VPAKPTTQPQRWSVKHSAGAGDPAYKYKRRRCLP